MSRRARTASLALLRARAFVLLTLVASAGATVIAPGTSAAAPGFEQPLFIPPVLDGSDISIDMRQADVKVMPTGPATSMWTFGGTFPGPTIRRRAGERTTVTFTNHLPPVAGCTTIHLHGEHATTEADGQPGAMPMAGHDMCDPPLIPVGGSHTYTYDFTERGVPERPAFQWYHDHRMGMTGRNVWMGLAGMMILDPPAGDTSEATLPSGSRDGPLTIADRTIAPVTNQLVYPGGIDGAVGPHRLVNGVYRPYFDVSDRMYRLRLLNASNATPYDLQLDDGRPMIQIATESGLLERPRTVTHIRLGPAERAEVVVDFAGLHDEASTRTVLLRDALVPGPMGELMQFRVTTHDPDDGSVRVPDPLSPAYPALGDPVLARTWILGRMPSAGDPLGPAVWTINGLEFDPSRDDAAPRLGDTERWIFVNATEVDHIVHIHDVDWRLVFRSGGIPADPDADVDVGLLKESFRIRPSEVIELVSTFTDHTGRFVFHCHILEHEDRSMMAQFNVAG